MLSKRTQYALKAVGYLASKHGSGPILISEIASRKNIPLKFLENILLELKQKGLLLSKKGKGGGYYLAFNPSDITMATVIRMVEGPIAMLSCVSLNFYKKCEDCNEEVCSLRQNMAEARDAVLKVLENKSLAQLADKGNTGGSSI